jgi:hypothetical protein
MPASPRHAERQQQHSRTRTGAGLANSGGICNCRAFLIAWKAITRGQNLEISWKITEKVTGRVVIMKVKTRAATTKRRAVA